MTAPLPELARDRLPVIEDAYLDVLVEYAEALNDPRAASPLWMPRQILEARLCALEFAHDAAVTIARQNFSLRGYLRSARDELLGTAAPRPTHDGRRKCVRPATRETTDYDALARLVRGRKTIAGVIFTGERP